MSKRGGPCLDTAIDMPGPFFSSRFCCLRRSSSTSFAALALPTPLAGETVDLRANYFRHARWFFGSFVTVLLVSLMKNLVMTGSLQRPLDLGFHLFWIAGATIAAVTRNDLFHKAFVCVSAASFVVYIAALFFELH